MKRQFICSLVLLYPTLQYKVTITPFQLTQSCLVLLLIYVTYVNYVFGMGGINVKNMLQQTRFCMCICVCMCMCLLLLLCVPIFLFVGMHYKFKSCCKIYYSKITSNISAYISPVRLRNTAGDLAGARVRVSGWGLTSDSKYNYLIVLPFNLKNCTYQNDCFKGKETHGLQKISGHYEYLLFILWHVECKDFARICGSVI